MLKYLLNFLFVFLLLSSFSFAKDDDAKLKKEFGPTLTQAPFFLRFSFYKKYHKDWKDTYYSERKYFLKNYETDLAAQRAKEKAEAKAQAAKEKERLLEMKETLQKEKDRLKAQLAEEKAQKDADAAKQKAFDLITKNQEKKLQQMEQEFAQEKEKSRRKK